MARPRRGCYRLCMNSVNKIKVDMDTMLESIRAARIELDQSHDAAQEQAIKEHIEWCLGELSVLNQRREEEDAQRS